MANKSQPTPKGARNQKLKLGLVPVLGLAFYLVFPGGVGEDVADALVSITKPVKADEDPVIPARNVVPILATVRPVEQIADLDPFALPELLRPTPKAPKGEDPDGVAGSRSDEDEAEPSSWEVSRRRWEKERVSIVLSTPTGLVAVIGDRMVRVGDALDESCRVVEIQADGIVVEPIDETEQDSSSGTL